MRVVRLPLAALSFVLLASAVPAQSALWNRQLGTTSEDSAHGVAGDGSGGVYLAGETWGSLGGPSAGLTDPWLARFDGAGNQVWVRQFGFGLDYFESASFAAADGAGGVYVGGGRCDLLCASVQAWFARYDAAGNELWNRSLPAAADVSAAAPDLSGGVYAGGGTEGSFGAPNAGKIDAWFARYDAAGNPLWIRQFGTSERDSVLGAVPDGSGGVYLCGRLGDTGASVGHAWFARYDGAGNTLWMRQLSTGSANTSARAVCSDGSGGVYVGGSTNVSLGGQPPVGGTDAFVARYDDLGNEVWTRILGTAAGDRSGSVAPDGSGGVFVAGESTTNSGGNFHEDVWLARFDAAGNLAWTRQLATSVDDEVGGAASDGAGGVFVGGSTLGALGGPSAGSRDAWLVRYAPDPAPYCTAKANSCGTTPAIGATGTPSSTASSGFLVSATDTKAQKAGLLLYTDSGPGNAPFLGGTLCLNTSPLKRSTPVVDTSGTPGLCDGSLSIDMNAFASGTLGGNPLPSLTVPGTRIHCQFWARDTPGNSLLSDALQYFVGS